MDCLVTALVFRAGHSHRATLLLALHRLSESSHLFFSMYLLINRHCGISENAGVGEINFFQLPLVPLYIQIAAEC